MIFDASAKRLSWLASDEVKQHLACFGYTELRAGQSEVIGALLEGHHALAILPTGGGKSFCYQLPALLLPGLSVVITPLLALMRDQVTQLQKKGIAAARLDSSLSAEEEKLVWSDLNSGKTRLLYLSPERFQTLGILSWLKTQQLGLIAVDEAHCVTEWGPRFRPDYLRLRVSLKRLKFHALLALTASATPKAARDIRRQFGISVKHHYEARFERPHLSLELQAASSEEERWLALTAALRGDLAVPAIVYVRTQIAADEVSGRLAKMGYKVRSYHAGMPADAREQVQAQFLQGELPILVATIAFGMGIDHPNIRQVIHYHLPNSLESYLQETGRAGRDRQPARAVAFVGAQDWRHMKNRILASHATPELVEAVLGQLLGSARGKRFVSLYDLSTLLDVDQDFLRVLVTKLEVWNAVKIVGKGWKRLKIKGLRELDGYSKKAKNCIEECLHEGEIWDLPAWALAREWDLLKLTQLIQEAVKAGDCRAEWKHTLIHVEVREFGGDLVKKCVQYFEDRKQQDENKLEALRKFLLGSRCLEMALVRHFGQKPVKPCGQCSVCSGRVLKRMKGSLKNLGKMEVAMMHRVHEKHARLRKKPESLAKFLCGISSPYQLRYRLWKLAEMGALKDYDFEEVLLQARLLS